MLTEYSSQEILNVKNVNTLTNKINKFEKIKITSTKMSTA